MSIYEDYGHKWDDVVDEYGREVSPYDDDYSFYKNEYDRRHDPLDDDYNKYDNE